LYGQPSLLFLALGLVVIGLVYKAYPDGCRHKYTFLPRLRPYPVRGHQLLRRCSLHSQGVMCLPSSRYGSGQSGLQGELFKVDGEVVGMGRAGQGSAKQPYALGQAVTTSGGPLTRLLSAAQSCACNPATSAIYPYTSSAR
jgi:hypothetical protein